MFEFNTLLVPIDFSPISRGVFDQAVQLVDGDDAAIILLHVVDPALADFAASVSAKPREEILEAMRSRAQQQLGEFKAEGSRPPEVQTIVCEGIPFVEILRKAEDFEVDAILMGKVGNRGQIEKLLFGTTAERVIRATTRPVIVMPLSN